MKEYIKLVEKIYIDADCLSVPEKYSILSRVLAETKLTRLCVGIITFVISAAMSGLLLYALGFSSQTRVGLWMNSVITLGIVFCSYKASQYLIVRHYMLKDARHPDIQ